MAKITEKDIINHLKEKIRFHQQESKRIEQLLSAFGLPGDIAEPANDNDDEIFDRNAAPKPEKKSLKKLEPPLQYSSNLTIVNKISYALGQINEGYSEEIAQVIADNEPDSDVKKISQLISGVISTLKKNGLISARKDGRKQKFSLVK